MPEEVKTDNGPETIDLKNRRWRYRRRIAVGAFLAVLITLFGLLTGYFHIEPSLTLVVESIIGGLILIVLGYQGLATVEDAVDKWKEKPKRNRYGDEG